MTEQDFSETLQKWSDQQNTSPVQSVQGFRNLIETLDEKYRDIEEFLSDNPGCLEAMVTWIEETGETCDGWKENLEAEIEEDEDDE